MTPDEYQRFWDNAVPLFADEKVRAGHWSPQNALEQSTAAFTALLPDGLNTPKNHLLTVRNEDEENVGYLFVAIKDFGTGEQVYIYEIFIWEAYRRRGYAKDAFLALEEVVAEWGYDTLALHVFGHNTAAIALYQKLDYFTTDVNMAKKISPRS
jgi:ribosomal protein S18 acetylase RimI-like enzyme